MSFAKALLTVGTAISLCTAGSASAATLVVNSGGQLTGATGVNVNGSLFDVRFSGGSCSGLYNGCDDISDFTFQTIETARAAAQALLDQVFIDSEAGLFDSNPGLTLGCAGPVCDAAIPFFIHTSDQVRGQYASARAINRSGIVDVVGINPNTPASTNSSNLNFLTFALFSPSQVAPPPVTPVPEPSTWLTMLIGFLGIGGAMRRKRGGVGLREAAAA